MPSLRRRLRLAERAGPRCSANSAGQSYSALDNVGYVLPNAAGVLTPQMFGTLQWAGGRTATPPDEPPACAADYVAVGRDQCELVRVASTDDQSGTWVNIALAVTALLVVFGGLLYAKRHSGSLVAALEMVASSVLPHVLAFCVEFSDMASDMAAALAVLLLPDMDGLTSTLRGIYAMCVFAHVAPSLYNLSTRARNLWEEQLFRRAAGDERRSRTVCRFCRGCERRSGSAGG